MINMKKIILGLLLILLVAGCSGLPDLGNLGGLLPGGNKVNKTELSPDLVVIQNINVVPNPPLNAGDDFTVSFEIKNQDDVNEVRSVNYELYDWGICQPPEQTTGTFESLAPLQTEFKQWSFKAPDNSQIGYLPTKCPIRFKANYSYTVASQIDVDVISSDRLEQLQKAGTPPSFTPNLVVGRGPIKIYFSIGAQMPVKANTTIPIFIQIQDKGGGLFGDITPAHLSINFPQEFEIINCVKFNCNTGSLATYCGSYKDNSLCDVNNDGIVDSRDIGQLAKDQPADKGCINNETIPMIKKSSPQLRCSVTVPSVDVEKTFYISGYLSYTYDVTGEATVDVKPTMA